MNKFLRYAATGATLSLFLFAGWGCSDDDNGGKTPPPGYTDPITLKEVGKNYVSYHIEAEEGATYRHLITSKQVLDNFTTGSRNEEEYNNAVRILMQLDGQNGTGAQDFVLRDLDPKPISQNPYSIIAGMKHVALLCPADEKGNPYGDIEMIEFSTPAPSQLSQSVKVEISDIRYDEADFTITPDAGIFYFFEYIFSKTLADEIAAGGKDKLKEQLFSLGSRITEFGELSEWTGLTAETDYVHLVLGVDKDGNQTKMIETPFRTPKAPETPTENIVFSQVPMASYYGQSEGDDGKEMYNFYVLLADRTMIADDYGDPYPTAFPCHAINCDFYTAAPAGGEMKIPEGTYTLKADYVAGACNLDGTWAAYFDEEENKTQIEFTAGTIAVAWEGDGYRITIDLTKEDGKAYTGTFTGQIQFEDYSYYAPSASEAPRKRFGFTGKAPMPVHRQ